MSTDSASGDFVPATGAIPVVPPAAQPADDQLAHETASVALPEQADCEDTLGSTIAWLLGLSLAQKSIGFIRSIVVCRWLDPVNMGAWGMALALMETLLPLALLSVPGCFGRYVEHFRQRGQLWGFVRQATVLCGATLGVAVLIAFCFQERLASLCFGSATYNKVFLFAVLCTVPSAIFAFCGELLVAMRLGKSSTVGTFCRGVTFTVLTIVFLLIWRTDVIAMISAFGVSYLLATVVVLYPVIRSLRALPADREALPVTRTWSGLSRFIIAYWLTDLLTNLFFSIDRYMLINLSSDGSNALHQVGNYESAHTIPVLVATIVLMISRLILPYQVREWEAGNREYVWQNINLSIKVTAVILFVGGWCLSFAARPIFDIWFRGQYDDGLSVMPLAIAIYSFTGIGTMWMNYFLCIERAWLGTVTTAVAVTVNIVANLLFVPKYGLMGAAWATLIANCSLIGCSMWVAQLHKLPIRFPTALLAFLPLAICIPPAAAAALFVALVSLLASGILITNTERTMIRQLMTGVVTKLRLGRV